MYGYLIIIGFICFFVIIVSLFFLRDVQNSINEQKSAWNTVISAPNSYEYFLDGQKKNKNFNIRAIDQESYNKLQQKTQDLGPEMNVFMK